MIDPVYIYQFIKPFLIPTIYHVIDPDVYPGIDPVIDIFINHIIYLFIEQFINSIIAQFINTYIMNIIYLCMYISCPSLKMYITIQNTAMVKCVTNGLHYITNNFISIFC